MKKVLFITNVASPYRVCFFDELAKSMDVTVVYSDSARDHKDRESAWFIQGQGAAKQISLSRRLSLAGRGNLCLDVIGWIRKPFDKIVLCGYSSPTFMLAIAYMKRKKIPFYMEVDGGLIREESGAKLAFKRSLVGAASGWLSTGEETTKYLIHYGAKPEKTFIYPFSSLWERDILPCVTGKAEKEALRLKLGIGETHMVLAVGQFIPRKGFDVLMEAAKDLPEAVGIYIVGGEPGEDYLRLRRKLGLENVHFVGFQSKESLSRYYRAADMFVLPTREDIWGLVINEAMAYGLPVITTDRCVAGLELVEEGVSGHIVPVEDAATLAEKIRSVLETGPEIMGAAALEAIRPYTIETMARAHVEIFDRS